MTLSPRPKEPPTPRLGEVVLSYLSVTGSTVAGPHSAVLMGGESGVGGFDDPDDGEIAQDAEAFGAPGIVFRPRAPEDVSTPDGTATVGAESIAGRTGRGLVPLAWRDLRFNRVFPNPSPGTVALVGYGGGFLSLDDTSTDSGDQKATVGVFYCPYEFSDGTPAKAHVVILDAEREQVSIVHGEGHSIVLTKDKEIMTAIDASTWSKMAAGEFSVQADAINLIGTVAIGNPTAAVALLGGTLSQPSTRLLITTP